MALLQHLDVVLVDFQGWAEADGQAGQHICALHEQQRLAIDFLGGTEEKERERERAGSEYTPTETPETLGLS